MTNQTDYRYTSLIVDDHLEARARLKQAAQSVATFGKLNVVGTMPEALNHLNGSERVDIVFVSGVFNRAELIQFIKDAKATPQGEGTACVVVMRSKDQGSAAAAQSALIGADGCLFEPYSVDTLIETTNLAARVRRNRAAVREEAALRLLVGDIILTINLVASLKAASCEVGGNLKKLRELCSVLRALEAPSCEVYFRLVLEMFESAPCPAALDGLINYSGKSARVRVRLALKAAALAERDNTRS